MAGSRARSRDAFTSCPGADDHRPKVMWQANPGAISGGMRYRDAVERMCGPAATLRMAGMRRTDIGYVCLGLVLPVPKTMCQREPDLCTPMSSHCGAAREARRRGTTPMDGDRILWRFVG